MLGTSRTRMNKARLVALRIVELNSNMEQVYSLYENGLLSEEQATAMMAGYRSIIEECTSEVVFYTKKKGDK
ncbi:hypothetical protein vBBceSLY5_0035 [Bacillus phage vB_BceS_LY5]|uniref:hypothetical protein n=1 Tax=Bacillus phage vB_BceS_LY5 TaxID=2996058 RepID=UPI0040552F7C|nr:hypothetical protein vBBceSLY5_0035 [Bacillus phage vB_BceS_LY5]